MKYILVIIFLIISKTSHSQKMDIFTLEGEIITISILDDFHKKELIDTYKGIPDKSLRKKGTSRTFVLSNKKILIEFFDKNAVLLNNNEDFDKLKNVKFIKNSIWNLKKNISYELSLNYSEAISFIKSKNPKYLADIKSDMVDYYGFKLYQLKNGQILVISEFENRTIKEAHIYPDLKTISSISDIIGEAIYVTKREDYEMEELAKGNFLSDYEPNEHLIYPKYLTDIIQNHELELLDSNIYISQFHSNLYRSKKGYFILIDEVNQQNGAGDKMQILTLKIYSNIDELRSDQLKYEKLKTEGMKVEHFYQKLSDEYGQNYPKYVDSLIGSLPNYLNIDKEQFSIDFEGIEIVDEALKWISTDEKLFDEWFPSILAYYGEFCIRTKKQGSWMTEFDTNYKVWIPYIKLDENSTAFDVIKFYKNMSEGVIPLRSAGGYYSNRK